MRSVLNAGIYVIGSRALSGRSIWPLEREQIRRALNGEDGADGLFKWLALAWAGAFIPVALLTVALGWVAQLAHLTFASDNVGALMGIPLAGCAWSLVRFAASAGDGRPNFADDLVVVTLGLVSWLVLPS